MNKAQEIHTLTAFIASLPHDSYLRPWLEQELAAIERAMQGDVPLEQYCHGFTELMDISKRLDEREALLAKRERDFEERLRTYNADKSSVRATLEGIRNKHRDEMTRAQALLDGWARSI